MSKQAIFSPITGIAQSFSFQAGISAAPARAMTAVKNMNLPQQLKDIKLPELPQAIKDLKL
jgi:hypothetical protein